jgi:Protein of unknown function (DUF2877)
MDCSSDIPVTVSAPAVTELGVLAQRALRQGRYGRIAAVFDRSLYAVFDDDWICIGSKAIGSGPLNVLCEGIAAGRFSRGQQIAITDTALLFANVKVTGLDVAPVWSPAPPPDWTKESLQAGILAVDRVWHVTPTEEGLAASGCVQFPPAPSRVLAAAMPGIAALKRLIEAGIGGHEAAPADGTDTIGLIGLGPGLTPSGDDLLSGALVALASLGFSDACAALWKVLCGHLDRTNDISAAHLRSAATGYAASALHEAIDAIMSGRIGRIAPALAAVSGIGHSSGRDAFAGALIVLRVVERCGNGAVQQAVAAARAA